MACMSNCNEPGAEGSVVHAAVRQEDMPSPEQVDRVQMEVRTSLENIFQTHKGLVGWSHKQLVFV